MDTTSESGSGKWALALLVGLAVVMVMGDAFGVRSVLRDSWNEFITGYPSRPQGPLPMCRPP